MRMLGAIRSAPPIEGAPVPTLGSMTTRDSWALAGVGPR